MVKKARPVLLYFHGAGISQADVARLADTFSAYDVRFRKVIREPQRDMVEAFDALAGDVPQHYLTIANAKGLKVLDEANTTTTGTSTSGVQTGTPDATGAKDAKTAPAGTVAPSPTSAPKPQAATIVPPPPAQ